MKEDITVKEMESDFKALYQDNNYKETLLKDEIRGYKLLFDKDELPLSGFSNKDKPLREYDIPYSSQQIFLIREFHRLYNVKKNDISKMYKTDWDSRTKDIYDSAWGDFLEPNALSEPHRPKYYILLAEKLSKYLEFLENYPVQNGEPIIKEKKVLKFSANDYAYYHYLNETYVTRKNIMPYGRKIETIELAKKLYPVNGVQFYNAYRKIKSKIKNLPTFISKMTINRRNQLKERTFEIAQTQSCSEYVKWWNGTFIEEV